ncbi:hypothetical protein [Mycobacterium sp. NAZ190054]|uniref:hypothetical protein n=1 Tax=Mycobacterium sp. NAZ190054 TaxID=1747766 RepID=UPI0007926683|nr:hypothetical protein [Mycobacterium sp. NAZ190054]KWX65538.1 hypothetical protein ASJ79_28635 [Mycobacterium sp. NAZ190054]
MTDVLGGSDDDESAGENHPEVRYLHSKPPAPKIYGYNELLSRLVGYHLQSVQFFPRYLQLAFESAEAPDTPVLTCEVLPVVDTPGGPVTSRQPGYADTLRSLIGEPVVETVEASREGLRICFAQAAVTVRPSVAELRGPVIAMLSDFNDGSSVSWRPGGSAFEYLG